MKPLRFILSLLFRLIVFVRNQLYDNGLLKQKTLDCPVISVGNISSGGSGKTPIVEYLAEYFMTKGKFPAIVCKGYGRTDKDIKVAENTFRNQKMELTTENFGDEPLMLLENLSSISGKCIVVTGDNKIRTAKFTCSRFKPDLIIIDDGFQHRTLDRDLDIAVTSQNESRHLIPLGTLREPRKNLKRADIIVVNEKFSRSDYTIVKNNYKTVKMKYEIKGIFNLRGENLKNNKMTKASIFCGIADPKSFRQTVESLNFSITASRIFRDHHNYTEKDIEKIINDFKLASADMILTTQKDFIRLKNSELILKKTNNNIYQELFHELPLFHIRIGVKLIDNTEILEKELELILRTI